MNFKSYKSRSSIQIQKDTRTCITKDNIEIEWEALQLLNIDLKVDDTPNGRSPQKD